MSDIHLTGNEWEIYECLWETAPLTLTQIARRFSERTGLTRSTGETMVARMEKKGLFRVEPGKRGKLFYPVLPREEAVRTETHAFLDKVYGGKFGLMMSAMAESEELTGSEIDELYAILRRAGEKRHD